MMRAPFLRVASLLPVCLLTFFAFDTSERVPPLRPPQSTAVASLSGAIVYVSDFDLDVFRSGAFPLRRQRPLATTATSPSSTKTRGESTKQSTQTSTKLDPDEERLDRANELINAMGQNVVGALRAYGYEARRLRRNQPRPEKGLLIRGVFAEPDDQNRARRLLFGGPSTAPKMILYVGVNNLKNPEQPLYVLASPPSPDSRYGPVITVTAYSPAARFELGKDPADEEIKKIATQIADNFSALLSANPLMSAQ
jgi:hypothetical protein